MDAHTFKTTEWRLIGNDERIRVKYGMHYIRGNKLPYFSMTCDIDRKERNRWTDSGGGAAHDLITKHFPELAPLVKWHLCDQDGTPMHYRANGMFWYGKVAGWDARGPYDHNPLACFKSTIIFDPKHDTALCNDEGEIKLSLSARELGEFLDARLPFVQGAFKAAMAAFEVEMIDMSEVQHA